MSKKKRSSWGFTLVELLVVLAIVAMLLAVLLPVLVKARRNAQETTCLSNGKQIGQAVSLYLQDYDGIYPRGLNALSKKSPAQDAWLPVEFQPEAITMPVFHEMLLPYTKEKNVFHCPLDIGFDRASDGGLTIQPDAFTVIGSSYFFMELFHSESEACFHHPSETPYATDLNSDWHSGYGNRTPFEAGRVNVLFYDNHVKNALYATLKDGHACD